MLSDLLGDDYGELFASLLPERRKRFNDIRTTFLNYPFSITLVVALVPSDLNIKIGAKAPSTYLALYKSENSAWDRTLTSHVITGDSRTALEGDDFLSFVEHRAFLLSKLATEVIETPSREGE
jgi:hypothetical protein